MIAPFVSIVAGIVYWLFKGSYIMAVMSLIPYLGAGSIAIDIGFEIAKRFNQ